MKQKMEDEKRRRIQMEDQARKRLEEQRTKAEAERKQKIEEARIKLQLEEEQRKKAEVEEQERRKLNEIKIVSTTISSPSIHSTKKNIAKVVNPEDFDLLGGLSDEEIEEEQQQQTQFSKHHQQHTGKTTTTLNSVAPNVSSGSTKKHRDKPQRGPVDVIVDQYFDSVLLSVPVIKQGKNDGFYLFGSRLIKIAYNENFNNSNNFDNINVIIGNHHHLILISEFISKFERIEVLKLKGLSSAKAACNLMSIGQFPSTIVSS